MPQLQKMETGRSHKTYGKKTIRADSNSLTSMIDYSRVVSTDEPGLWSGQIWAWLWTVFIGSPKTILPRAQRELRPPQSLSDLSLSGKESFKNVKDQLCWSTNDQQRWGWVLEDNASPNFYLKTWKEELHIFNILSWQTRATIKKSYFNLHIFLLTSWRAIYRQNNV